MADGGSPFDFDTAFQPEPRPGPEVAPPRPSGHRQLSRTMARGPMGASSLGGAGRRGQGLSWTALGLAVLAALGVAVGVYRSLTGIHVSLDPLGGFWDWMTLVAFSACAVVVALAAAVLAAVRARPRTVAALSVTASLVLPTIAAILGTKFGVDALRSSLRDEAVEFGGSAARALQETLTDRGMETNWMIDLLLRLLG